MSKLAILYNPDRTEFALRFDNDDETDVFDVPDDGGTTIVADDDDPNVCYLVTHNDPGEGLQPDTIYRLKALPTIVAELEDEDEDEEEDPGDGGDDPDDPDDDDPDGGEEAQVPGKEKAAA